MVNVLTFQKYKGSHGQFLVNPFHTTTTITTTTITTTTISTTPVLAVHTAPGTSTKNEKITIFHPHLFPLLAQTDENLVLLKFSIFKVIEKD